MLRHSGQAAREVGRFVHLVCHVLLSVGILLSLAAAAGAWRLSRGPLNVGFIKGRVETALNNATAPTRIRFGGASVAWGGFSHGLDQPLVLRVTDLVIDEASVPGGAHVPIADATLSARWLLIGHIVPRSLTLVGADLVLVRNADGTLNFDIGVAAEQRGPGPLADLMAILGAPRESDLKENSSQAEGDRMSQLSAVSIRDARLRLEDHRLGTTMIAERADIDLTRHAGGGMDGRGTLLATLGGQKAIVEGSFTLAPAARSVHVVASLSQITPKALAGAAPILAPLAALNLPMTLDGEADFGGDLSPAHFRLVARAGAGTITVGPVPTGDASTGAAQTGSAQTGSPQSGSPQSGSAQSGSAESGAVQTGAVQTGAVQTGVVQTGAVQTGAVQTGVVQTGAVQTGAVQTGPTPAGPVSTDPATAGSATVGAIPVRRAELILAGTMEQVGIDRLVLEVQPGASAPVSTVNGTGQIVHQDGRLGATLHLTLDHVAFADLPAVWPENIAGDVRNWITQNVRAGVAHDGLADLVLQSPDTAPEPVLTNATATLEGDGVSVIWGPTVPPVAQAKAHLVLADPDNIEIDVKSARQMVNGAEPIAIPSGRVTITGVSHKDQTATILCDATGAIASAITLLKEPRLHILDRYPMDLREPAGAAAVTINAVVPLEKKLTLDEVTIQGTGTLSRAHLTAVVDGKDLDDGEFALDVDTDHLSLKGTGKLAAIPSKLDIAMDFRSGPPSQVTQRYQMTARTTAKALAEAGFDTDGALGGEVGLTLAMIDRRDGSGELTADADLGQAELMITPLAWRKPAGGAAKASARLLLTRDKLTGIDRISVNGPGIQVAGIATVIGGRVDAVRLDRGVLGRTDLRGTIRLPKNGPIGIDVTGPELDFGPRVIAKTEKRKPGEPPPTFPALSIRARFDRVLLAHGRILTDVSASGQSDGQIVRALDVTGKIGASQPFSARIGPAVTDTGKTVRRLTIASADAGAVLWGTGITSDINGGTLAITGDFDDASRAHPLSGTLEIADFTVSQVPALAKLLQAVTLYGLVDALGGPGVHFTSLTMPFRLDDDTLAVHDARAYSSSLGVTVEGTINRGSDYLDLSGTLVPVYIFNAFLGHVPLIGRLFSPETGGGLFAMGYSLRGPFDNPSVMVNPLSALTPGFLRGVFRLFDRAPVRAAPAPSPSGQTRLDQSGQGGNVQKP